MAVQLPDFARTFIVRCRVVARRVGPGAISESDTAASGTGYAPGDTFTVDGGGGTLAAAEVDTVDGDTGVSTYHFTEPGIGYVAGSQSTVNVIGTGTGLVIVIEGVSRDDIEDSAWEAVGVLRGNGEDAYSWVGGTTPTFDVIAQDAACAAWVVAFDDAMLTDPSVAVAVTGEVGKDILWECTLELDEVG